MAQDRTFDTSRRLMLGTGLGALTTALLGPIAAAQQPAKLAKSVVLYQDHPKGDQKCSLCINFLPPDACKTVAGDISPDGWCGVFTPKRS